MPAQEKAPPRAVPAASHLKTLRSVPKTLAFFPKVQGWSSLLAGSGAAEGPGTQGRAGAGTTHGWGDTPCLLILISWRQVQPWLTQGG